MKKTPEEFEKDKERLMSLSGSTVELYRLIAVEGLSQTEAAKRMETSKQNANQQLKRVKALLEGFPSDWEHVSAWLPKDKAQQVRQMEQAARKEFKSIE